MNRIAKIESHRYAPTLADLIDAQGNRVGGLQVSGIDHVSADGLLSAIVCTAVLGEPFSAANGLPALGITRNDSDRAGHFNFAWPLTQIERLEPPIPAKGAQGFWEWTR